MSDVISPQRRRAVLGLVVLATVAFGAVMMSSTADPVVAVDEPLPDLPAVTLTGERLDARFFGDRPWVVLVWLPG